MFRFPVLTRVLATALVGLAPAAFAASDDTSGAMTLWTVTDADGQEVGVESLRVVTSASGATYASGEREIKKGTAKGHRKSFVQRLPDGALKKYQRVEAGRKGKGVHAFQYKGGVRIVGVHAPGKPLDRGAVGSRHVWDATVFHHLALLVPRLAGKGGVGTTAEVPFFDPAARADGRAVLTPGAVEALGDADGKRVDARIWTVTGAPAAEGLTLYVTPKGRLAGVRQGALRMLRKGWSWASRRPDAGDEDAEPAAGTPAADGDEAQPGVGP